jgi:formate dehydrogenase gamma subunit
MLQGSVHNEKVLDESNELLGHPLDEHQSRCLLCHDEPVFHQDAESLGEQKAPIERCNVCHDHRLSVDTRYYYWHVFARSRPARKHANLVRVCAVCHSNPSILNKFEMPNSIASYLASFHGKAMELGSEETAVCLDCHIGPLQNIHVMQSPAQTDSPTNSKHLADTCRSPECHPSAGKRMSSAAVHLNISTSRGIEYLVACLFVLLIIFTFGPSLLLTSLEILQVVIGRTDPGHHKRLRLAERLLMFPEGRVRLERFNLHHRIQHWVLVACFATLVATGFPIKFADRAWAGWMISHLGGLPVTRFMHRWMGMLLILGFVYHLGYTTLVIRKRIKASGKTVIQTILALPMVMRREDLRQMKHLLGYLFFIRRDRPKAGRFSLEEKFEYFGVFWGAVLLGATGLLMWHSNWTTRYLTGRILTLAALVHTFEAFLALLHVGIVHMVTVIFAPSVFPVSPAMFTGTTPPEELAEGHAAMIEEAAQELQIDIDHNEIESGNEKANNDKADKEVDHD